MAGRMGNAVMAALMNGMAREESSEDEDEVDYAKIVKDAYEKMKMKARSLCVVAAAGMEKVAAAERWQQQSVGVMRLVEIERVKMIENDVATAAAAAEDAFQREVIAEMTATALVWSDDADQEVVMKKDVVWYGDWMREWEAQTAGLGGGV